MTFLKVKLYARDEWVIFPLRNLTKATIDMNGSTVLYVREILEPLRLDSNEHGPGAPGDLCQILKELEEKGATT